MVDVHKICRLFFFLQAFSSFLDPASTSALGLKYTLEKAAVVGGLLTFSWSCLSFFYSLLRPFILIGKDAARSNIRLSDYPSLHIRSPFSKILEFTSSN